MFIITDLIDVKIEDNLTTKIVNQFLSQNNIVCNPKIKVIGVIGQLIVASGFMSSVCAFSPLIGKEINYLVHPNVVFIFISFDMYKNPTNPFSVIAWKQSVDMCKDNSHGAYKENLRIPQDWNEFSNLVGITDERVT
jgi:hypothetical protein